MNFGRAFTYVSEDPEWLKKVGIAALVILIPVIGSIVLMGWGMEIIRRVINDDPQPLPDWDNFGGFLSNGFKELVAVLAYVFPICLIYGCGFALAIGSSMALSGGKDSDTGSGIGLVFLMCAYCFVILYALAMALMLPPAVGNLAATGELGAAFRFGEIFGLLRAAIGPYLLTLLIMGLAAAILAPLGSVVCGVGLLAASAYLTAVRSHLYGQAYKIAKAAPLAPPM